LDNCLKNKNFVEHDARRTRNKRINGRVQKIHKTETLKKLRLKGIDDLKFIYIFHNYYSIFRFIQPQKCALNGFVQFS